MNDALDRLAISESATTTSELLCDGTPDPDPTRRLPAEILADIFCYLPWADLEDLEGQNIHSSTPRHMAVSHVCQRWRRIAFDCSELWTQLFIDTPDWTPIVLELSNSRRLTIHAHYDEVCDPAGIDSIGLALQDMARVQAIHLVGHYLGPLYPEHDKAYDGTEFPLTVLDQLRNVPVPALETLRIKGSLGDVGLTIPQDIFLGETPPALHVLRLGRCDITPLHPLFRAPLTTLDLQCVEHVWKTAADLQETVRGLPQLRELTLHNVIGPEQEDLSSLVEVHLPMLEVANLRGPIHDHEVIFAALRFPPNVRLSVTFKFSRLFGEPREREASRASKVLRRHLSAAIQEKLSFQHVSFQGPFDRSSTVDEAIRQKKPSRVRFRACTCARASPLLPFALEICSEPSIPRDTPSRYARSAVDIFQLYAMQFATAVCDRLRRPLFESVECVGVDHPLGNRTADWVRLGEVFGNASQVVAKEYVTGLFPALGWTAPWEHEEDGRKTPICFTRMRDLEIIGADLRLPGARQMVESTIEIRKGLQMPFDVKFVGCHIPREALPLLKASGSS